MLEWGIGGEIMTIGDNIKSIRTEKKISQKKLAELSGLGVATIQRIEYGQLNPKKETLHKIALALNVPDTRLDNSLQEILSQWDTSLNVSNLKKEAHLFELLNELYGEDVSSTIHDFLSLNDFGKCKVSEYIDLLLSKYSKQ